MDKRIAKKPAHGKTDKKQRNLFYFFVFKQKNKNAHKRNSADCNDTDQRIKPNLHEFFPSFLKEGWGGFNISAKSPLIPLFQRGKFIITSSRLPSHFSLSPGSAVYHLNLWQLLRFYRPHPGLL